MEILCYNKFIKSRFAKWCRETKNALIFEISKHFEEERYLILRLILIIECRKPLILLRLQGGSVRTLAPDSQSKKMPLIFIGRRSSVGQSTCLTCKGSVVQVHSSSPRRSKVRFAPTLFYAYGIKSVICPLPGSSFSKTGHVRFGCSLVNALATPLAHYQPVLVTGVQFSAGETPEISFS